MIVWFPLEPLEERYTADWYEQFPREFKRLGIDFLTIHGIPLTQHIETGSILDAHSTIHWKMSQLAVFARALKEKRINNGDVLFFADLWHPGIESIRYITAQADIDLPIVGIMHAGTYDPNDFTVRTGMQSWGAWFEQMLGRVADLVFVGTEYHKRLLIEQRSAFARKVVVTGLPFYAREVAWRVSCSARQGVQTVVFPHRLDPEKRPDLFEQLDGTLDAVCVRTAPIFAAYGKQAYYEALHEATVAVSFAEQETWGYAMLEAAALGCIPVVPDRLSYREIFPAQYRYRSFGEAVAMTKAGLAGTLKPIDPAVLPGADAVERMISACQTYLSRRINSMSRPSTRSR